MPKMKSHRGAKKRKGSEPYVKYLKTSLTTNTTFTINGTDRNFDVTGSVGNIGLGAQLGVQFLISDVVVIDWFLIGPEANSSSFRFTAQETGTGAAWDTGAAGDAQQQIQDFIDAIPIINKKAGLEVNSNARYEPPSRCRYAASPARRRGPRRPGSGRGR